MQFELERISWPYRTAFRISYNVEMAAETLEVRLHDGGFKGRGEAMAVYYRGESLASMEEQIRTALSPLDTIPTREELLTLMPAGAARFAVDSALWDIEAKRSGRRAWELAGLSALAPVETDLTIGVDSADVMASNAAAASQIRKFKLKLNGEGDLERVMAVREARPDAQITVDPNQSWSIAMMEAILPELARLGVKLVEQPLPVGKDEFLSGYRSPVPLCADESCQTAADLPALVGKYSYVNIKLEKTGGLTAALMLASEAKSAGFELMVGCMGGSSLSMVPGMIIAQQCKHVDLDSPLLATRDRPHAIRYDGGLMSEPDPRLWG